MSIVALLRRLHLVRDQPEPERFVRASDRSDLLRELEVSVPAPERIVGWEAARGTQRLTRT
jgi:hypothetical protein